MSSYARITIDIIAENATYTHTRYPSYRATPSAHIVYYTSNWGTCLTYKLISHAVRQLAVGSNSGSDSMWKKQISSPQLRKHKHPVIVKYHYWINISKIYTYLCKIMNSVHESFNNVNGHDYLPISEITIISRGCKGLHKYIMVCRYIGFDLVKRITGLEEKKEISVGRQRHVFGHFCWLSSLVIHTPSSKSAEHADQCWR